MRIPRYWARVVVDSQGRPASDSTTDNFLGRRPGIWAYGWSDTSEQHARELGYERARHILRRLQTDVDLDSQYPYPDRPLREEIIEQDDQNRWLITRNGYGSLVLNTASVMFIDIDQPWRLRDGWLNKLLRRRAPVSEEIIIQQTRDALQSLPGLAGRLYRTAAGFRLLVTSETHAPDSELASDIMTACHADEKYTFFCKKQQSFRARLTPKPWRCGHPMPPAKFPYDTPKQAEAMSRWVDAYAQASRRWAVCRFIETIGPSPIATDIAPIVELHDRYTGTASPTQLA